MPRRMLLLLFFASLVLAQAAAAATEVSMTGDTRVFGLFFANRNFTGWNETGTQTEDRTTFWQRLRLRADFVANENLKFRFGMRIDDEAWGHDYLTAANPQVAIEPYLAYLQFKFPDTDIEVTAGYQPLAMPHAAVFYDSIVLAADDGDQASAALHVALPVNEHLSIEIAYGRLLNANRTFQPTTTQVGDAFDISHLALPVTMDGFSATPWGLVGVYGKGADPDGLFDTGLRSGGSYLSLGDSSFKNNQNALWWAGLTLTVDALDPFVFYADAIYGDAAPGDRERNRRRGYFLDAGVTFSGLGWAVPGVFGWLGSGEDASLANGSERLPVIAPKWGPGTSFLFDCDQEFANNNMAIDPTGTWGLAASLRDISLIDALSSRLTLAVIAGTNSPAGLRKAVTASGGGGQYLTMGRNLAAGEWVFGINCDNTYAITEQLSLTLQTGYATPQGLRTSIWGHRFTNQAADAFMGALGFVYVF